MKSLGETVWNAISTDEALAWYGCDWDNIPKEYQDEFQHSIEIVIGHIVSSAKTQDDQPRYFENDYGSWVWSDAQDKYIKVGVDE